jgi:hypothetical protein
MPLATCACTDVTAPRVNSKAGNKTRNIAAV